MPRITFSVPFVKGKERPRFTARGRTYTPAATVQAEGIIWQAYVAACGGTPIRAPGGVEVSVAVWCTAPVPKSTPKRVGWLAYTRKPDVDNVLKLVLDALNPSKGGRGGAWADDAQVTDAHVRKWRRTRGALEETRITISWEGPHED